MNNILMFFQVILSTWYVCVICIIYIYTCLRTYVYIYIYHNIDDGLWFYELYHVCHVDLCSSQKNRTSMPGNYFTILPTQWSEGRPARDFHKGAPFRRDLLSHWSVQQTPHIIYIYICIWLYMHMCYIQFTSCGTEDLGMSHILRNSFAPCWHLFLCYLWHSLCQWPFGSFLDPFGFFVFEWSSSLLLWTFQTLEGSEFGPFLPARTVSAGSGGREKQVQDLTGSDMSHPFSFELMRWLTSLQLTSPLESRELLTVRCRFRWDFMTSDVPSEATPWLRPLAPTCEGSGLRKRMKSEAQNRHCDSHFKPCFHHVLLFYHVSRYSHLVWALTYLCVYMYIYIYI